MNSIVKKYRGRAVGLAVLLLFLLPVHADAVIDGVTGTTFNLTASAGYISTAEGNSVHIWGYGITSGTVQYPGPTMIVNQGDTVTVNLTNDLSVPVSIVFPGHQAVPTGGTVGLLTAEAASSGGTVSYEFTASEAGTYMYYSGTQQDLQIEMGLVGAIIVRPTGFNDVSNRIAYEHADSAYDHEYLFLLSEIDVNIHEMVEFGMMDQVDTAAFYPVYWFINGRTAPDTMVAAGATWLPTQPYNCMPRMHPGEKLLMRVVGAGRDLHPYHTHGNNFWMIARDGRMLESVPGTSGPDLAENNFTLKSIPGKTADAIFEWTGEGLGWDIYGDPTDPDFTHTCVDGDSDDFDDTTFEYCPDHGVLMPVELPNQRDLTLGGFWSGSPFLGAMGALPPGEGGLNMYGGLAFMWHSHNEKEMVNFDIFPGGMMTMMLVEPPGSPIP